MAIIRLEPLAEHHLASVVEIEKESNGAPWSEGGFRNELDHRHSIFLVALADGEPIGFGGAWLVIDEAHIVNVAVRPSERRNGIGRRLVVRLLQDAKEAGMHSASLEVRAGNAPAIALYESLGFVATNRRRHYYPDNREDAVVMWLYDLDAWNPPRSS